MMIRKQIRLIRQKIPYTQKKIYMRAVFDKFNELFPNLSEFNIASYIPLSEEISPELINQKMKNNGNKLYYPVINSFYTRKMWFVKDSGQWGISKFNTKEPFFELSSIISPWDLDLVIVPLVAFDKDKNRLGMGGGYYDTSFSFKKIFSNPKLIGIAFDEQYQDNIAINDWDIKMDHIITPTKII